MLCENNEYELGTLDVRDRLRFVYALEYNLHIKETALLYVFSTQLSIQILT